MHVAGAGEHEQVIALHLVDGHEVVLGVKLALELAEQEAERVAEAAVGVGGAGEDLVVDGDIVARVG